MFKTIQTVVVLVAGAWALLAAMMTQPKEQAVTNLRTWLPDAVVDLLAAMPEPLIANRNLVYAGLAVLAFGLVLGPPAYRVAIDRDKRLSISGRVKTVISRLRKAGLSSFESTLIAILVSSMLYVAQSWALVSVIGGVLIFYALSQRSDAAAGLPSSVATLNATIAAATDPQTHRDYLQLLDFVKFQSTIFMFDNLLNLAPDNITDGPLKLGTDFLPKYTEAQQFIEIIRDRMDPGTERRSSFERAMYHASNMAERQLEYTPIEQRPSGIDHLLLRKCAIAHLQCVNAIEFLKSQRAKTEQYLLNQRPELLKRYHQLHPA
jgi:hypothetical protein